jgi:PAS domain S-box-containing protein
MAIFCYQTDRLAYALGVSNPKFDSFWPTTPILVALLVLAPRRIWSVLIAAGLVATVLADLRNGTTISLAGWSLVANLAEVLVAALAIASLSKGSRDLSAVKTLIKYFAFAVVLAPAVSALFGANGRPHGEYWLTWRLWFFSDALGFLLVTPAILSWVREGREWARKPLNYLELTAQVTLLVAVGHFAFMGAEQKESPALLYSLVPILLWAALRLGLKGVSTSMILITLMAISGAAHDRGPFAGAGPLSNTLSIQLFLFFAAIPFMLLAVFVEDQKRAKQVLINEQRRLAEAQRVAQLGSWQWEPKTDTVTWSEELYRIAGRDPHSPAPSYKEHGQLYTPESCERLQRVVEKALETGEAYELDLEMVRPDGTTRWIISRGEVDRDPAGQVLSLRGTAKDITERKRAEATLRESEERFRLVANTAPVMIWMADVNGLCTYVNQPWLEFTGRTVEAELGNGWRDLLNPEDVDRYLNIVAKAMDRREPFRNEHRLRRYDGEYRWMLGTGVPRFHADGSFAGYIGSCVDVTERKRVEETLSTLGQRLIEAHEEERTRIARELHDDINQRIALLVVSFDRLVENLPSSAVGARQEAGDAIKQVKALGSDIQVMSHTLHSSKLDLLGLTRAAESFCRELAERQQIEIDFHSENIPSDLPNEISLCLFRVLQEALQNAVKHSGSRRTEVSLSGVSNEIGLTVRDFGIGFNLEEAMNGRGLGLTSMNERMKIVGGQFFVESKPQHGTTIQVRVPMTQRMSSVGAGE